MSRTKDRDSQGKYNYKWWIQFVFVPITVGLLGGAGIWGLASNHKTPGNSNIPDTLKTSQPNPIAWLIDFNVHYLPINSDPVKIAWEEILSKLGTHYIKTDHGIEEIYNTVLTDDAKGQFVLTTRKLASNDKFQIAGIGFYDETVPIKSGGRYRLYWALDFQSASSVTKEQLVSGIGMTLNFQQKGFGVSLPFDAHMSFKDYKLTSDSANVTYKGTHIATIVITNSVLL